jgi:hypothetical protein
MLAGCRSTPVPATTPAWPDCAGTGTATVVEPACEVLARPSLLERAIAGTLAILFSRAEQRPIGPGSVAPLAWTAIGSGNLGGTGLPGSSRSRLRPP